MTYTTTPRNVLPNGLTLLQQNPDCAARLDPGAKDHGWLYTRGADHQWVTLRKLSDAEIDDGDRDRCAACGHVFYPAAKRSALSASQARWRTR